MANGLLLRIKTNAYLWVTPEKTWQINGAGSLTLSATDAGQGLSERCTPFDAIVQLPDSEADLMIGGEDARTCGGREWIKPKAPCRSRTHYGAQAGASVRYRRLQTRTANTLLPGGLLHSGLDGSGNRLPWQPA